MKKIVIFLAVLCVFLTSCATTTTSTESNAEISSIGKEGTVTLKIASNSTVVEIDGETTKLKGTCKLEPGRHSFKIDYNHFTLSYSASGYGYKEFFFEDGKSYTMNAIENGKELLLPIRENTQVISDTTYFFAKAQAPKEPAKKTIPWLKTFPDDRKYKVVGTFEFVLTGGAFATASLTEELACTWLEYSVAKSEYDVDAFIDGYAYRGFSGQIANAIGIKYIE